MAKRSKGILMEVLGPCHDMKAGRHAMGRTCAKARTCHAGTALHDVPHIFRDHDLKRHEAHESNTV